MVEGQFPGEELDQEEEQFQKMNQPGYRREGLEVELHQWVGLDHQVEDDMGAEGVEGMPDCLPGVGMPDCPLGVDMPDYFPVGDMPHILQGVDMILDLVPKNKVGVHLPVAQGMGLGRWNALENIKTST